MLLLPVQLGLAQLTDVGWLKLISMRLGSVLALV
jgi:hypothetical protein